MFKSNFFKKISSLMVVAVIMLAAFVPGAFALNYNGDGSGSGNKAFNFNGYKYDPNYPNQLKLYFDKQISTTDPQIVAEHFSVYNETDSQNVTISSITRETGEGKSGCSDTYLTKGTTVTLNFASDLPAGKLYRVTMKASTMADKNGITLGNYNQRNDITFKFQTPNNGTYSGTPYFTFLPNITSDVPQEGNVVVIIDRPVTSNIATFKSNLDSNFKKNGDVLTKDDTIDANAVQNAECYTSHANVANTTFFFPETSNSNDNVCYNLGTSGNYTLMVPSFDYSGGSYTQSGTSDYSFNTVSSDIAGWLDNTPTVDNATSSSLRVNWSAGTIEPVATDFDIYMSTNRWSDFSYVATVSSTPYQYTKTGLSPNTTYYFRIVPVGDYEAGFSLAGSGTTLP